MRQLLTLLRRQEGFSLVEVIIGTAILGIALASAFSLSYQTAQATQSNQNLAAAASLAEFKLEELRNADYEDIVTDADDDTLDSLGNEGTTFTRSWTVVDDTPADGLKTVTVAVEWDQWGETRSYTIDGVIGDD